MEELILVTGCTLVTSWAAAVFMDNNIEAQISLASNTPNNGGASLVWREIRGPVVYRNSRFDPVRSLGYVYLARIEFFFVVWKAESTHDSGSMRLHSGLPRKARPLFGPRVRTRYGLSFLPDVNRSTLQHLPGPTRSPVSRDCVVESKASKKDLQ